MTNAQFSPKEIIGLLAQNGVLTTDREAFVKSFKALYPTLPATDRAALLIEILAYVDSTLAPNISNAVAA